MEETPHPGPNNFSKVEGSFSHIDPNGALGIMFSSNTGASPNQLLISLQGVIEIQVLRGFEQDQLKKVGPD